MNMCKTDNMIRFKTFLQTLKYPVAMGYFLLINYNSQEQKIYNYKGDPLIEQQKFKKTTLRQQEQDGEMQ